jgi:hypothetical protein
VGTSVTDTTPVSLNDSLQEVMQTPAVSGSGTYYVNASVMLDVAPADTVRCALFNSVAGAGAWAGVGPVTSDDGSGVYETIPLTAMVQLTAGTSPEVLCEDTTSNASTDFYDGSMTSVLINSPAGT